MSNGSYVVEAPADPLVKHSDSVNMFDIVLLAEGFTFDEQNLWLEKADELALALFDHSPFSALDCELAINVWRVDVVSEQTGMGDPTSCLDGTGYNPKTFFDASRCSGGVQRSIDFDELTAAQVATEKVPEWNVIFVVINSPLFAGSSSNSIRASAFTTASSPEDNWIDVALHEFGHSGFGLADEYEFWRGCDTTGEYSDPPDQYHYTGGEPSEPNVTTNSDLATIKWANWVTPTATPVLNLDCSKCISQTSPLPLTDVGAFEGAQYYHCGIFRPVFVCRMYNNAVGFCPVCSDWIRKNLIYTVFDTWPKDNDPNAQVDPWSPELAWTPGLWESAWEIQISEQPDFGGAAIISGSKPPKIVNGQKAAYVTAEEIGTLKPDTSYSWRVRKKTATGPQPKAWTQPRTFKTAPKKATPVSPRSDNRFQTQYPWRLQFTWIGPEGSDADHYEIQVTDKLITNASGQHVPDWSHPIFPTVVTDNSDGTMTELTVKVKSSMHWRVRAIPAAGPLYAGVWSDPLPLITKWPKVVIAAPENGKPTYPWPVRLEWKEVKNAVKYKVEIQLRKDQWGFDSIQKPLQNLTTTHVELNLRPRRTSDNETHTWRVRVWGPPLGPVVGQGTGEEGKDSGQYTFINDGDATAPGSYTLIDAENGENGVPWAGWMVHNSGGDVYWANTLNWGGVVGATEYDLWLRPWDETIGPGNNALLSKYPVKENPDHWQKTIRTDQEKLNPPPGVAVEGYEWDVWAIGPENLIGLSMGKVWKVGLDYIEPDVPVPISPAADSTGVKASDLTFSFSSRYTPSGKYRVQLQGQNLHEATIPGNPGGTTSFGLGIFGLDQSSMQPGSYQWRVRACADESEIDALYPWGPTWKFTIAPASQTPPAPSLICPIGGQLIPGTSVWFAWSEVPGATQYEFVITPSTYIGGDLTYSLNELDSIESGKVMLRLGYDVLEVNTQYLWMVRANVNGVWSDWAPEATFVSGPSHLGDWNTDCSGGLT
jgi:IgA Peptidase M64